MATTTTSQPSYLDTLEGIITEIIAPLAVEIDQTGAYPFEMPRCWARAVMSPSMLLQYGTFRCFSPASFLQHNYIYQ